MELLPVNTLVVCVHIMFVVLKAGHMEPSLSLFNQPSPGSPATSAEEEQQYIQKRVCAIY